MGRVVDKPLADLGYKWNRIDYELENAIYLHNIPKEKKRRWIAQPILIIVGAIVSLYNRMKDTTI